MNQAMPLIDRPGDQVIALRNGSGQVRSPRGNHPGELIPVRVNEWARDVLDLAEQLPPARHLINLCADRYHFLVSFCAGLIRQQCTLLAPNRLPATQTDLARRYPDAVVLHDGQAIAQGLADLGIDLSERSGPNASLGIKLREMKIDPGQSGAICFTSGSTGQSTATRKSWQTLAQSTTINKAEILRGFEHHHSLLATVPAQHMYGMETSILLPLQADLCIHPGHPLYPEDIRRALLQMPAPRILVTTPAHLRALVRSNLQFPAVALVLSATAPLDRNTAKTAQSLFAGEIREIYGCSEVGCIARRNPVEQSRWEPFEVFRLQPTEQGVLIDADHLPEPVPLQDQFLFDQSGCFSLAGRLSDLINIAGKRGSLAELNQLLLSHPQVLDGVIFQTDNDAQRLSALVVAAGISAADIRQFLRSHIDPVFIPRPLLLVDELPRNSSGKLPKAELMKLLEQARARGKYPA